MLWLVMLFVSADPVTVDVCDLVKSPAKYDGKMVRVRATIRTGFEFSGLKIEQCGVETNIWVSFGELKIREEDIDIVEFAVIPSRNAVRHPERLAWRTPVRRPRIVFREDERFNALMEHYKPEDKSVICLSCPLYVVTATFAGLFKTEDRRLKAYRRKGDPKITIGRDGGFGHLNASPMELVVQSVEDVVGEPIDPATYERRP